MLEFVNIFCAGILAGLEISAHYAIHPSTVALDEKPQITARQGLIRKLRWLVPGFFVPMTLSGIAIVITGHTMPGFYLRLAAMLAIAVWIAIRIVGTVPVNSVTLEWNPDAPPKDWRQQVSKVERFHVIGTWAAILAFLFFLIALAVDVIASGLVLQ